MFDFVGKLILTHLRDYLLNGHNADRSNVIGLRTFSTHGLSSTWRKAEHLTALGCPSPFEEQVEELDLAVHTYSPRTWRVETGGQEFKKAS